MCKYDTEIDENGVEVNYTTDCELYHLTSEDGEYDAKIDVHGNGTETYTTEDGWVSHDHYHTDEDGNTTECHGMEERDWEDKCRALTTFIKKEKRVIPLFFLTIYYAYHIYITRHIK